MLHVFGEYVLDTQRRELRCAGVPVKLEPKAYQILTYLVQHRGRLVTKAELLKQVWPGVYVADTAVARCLTAIRQAVGDSGTAQRVIQTRHGQGYRFVAPVREQDMVAPVADVPDRQPALATATTPPLALLAPATVSVASPQALQGVSLPAWDVPTGERKLVTLLDAALTPALGGGWTSMRCTSACTGWRRSSGARSSRMAACSSTSPRTGSPSSLAPRPRMRITRSVPCWPRWRWASSGLRTLRH